MEGVPGKAKQSAEPRELLDMKRQRAVVHKEKPSEEEGRTERLSEEEERTERPHGLEQRHIRLLPVGEAHKEKLREECRQQGGRMEKLDAVQWDQFGTARPDVAQLVPDREMLGAVHNQQHHIPGLLGDTLGQ